MFHTRGPTRGVDVRIPHGPEGVSDYDVCGCVVASVAVVALPIIFGALCQML